MRWVTQTLFSEKRVSKYGRLTVNLEVEVLHDMFSIKSLKKDLEVFLIGKVKKADLLHYIRRCF